MISAIINDNDVMPSWANCVKCENITKRLITSRLAMFSHSRSCQNDDGRIMNDVNLVPHAKNY